MSEVNSQNVSGQKERSRSHLKILERYATDAAYREYQIKTATEHSQADSECPSCLKKMKRGSVLTHLKICKGWREPTALESILKLSLKSNV